MRAWRSDSGARTASSLCTPRRIHPLVLITILILASLVPAAGLAAPSRSTARVAPDTSTSDNSGFNVRVTEKSAGRHGARPAPPALPDVPKAPDVPEPPDVPQPPDVNDQGQNDLVRFGEDITIPADKTIEGGVVAIGGNVTVLGRVKGDVTAVGGTVEVKGHGVIEGDAVSLGGGVSTSDSASVAGSNVSIGTMRFWRGGGMLPMMGLVGAMSLGAWLVSTIVKLLLTLFFAWVALLLWKDGVLRAAAKVREQFGKSFLWGLLTMAILVVALPVSIVALVILSVIAIVILCITIIGIPIAVLLVIALVIAIIGLVIGVVFLVFLGYLNGALYLGQRVLGERGRDRSPLYAIGVGILLMAVLGLVGHLVSLAGVMLLYPLGIAFGFAARALAFILTMAGLGAIWLSVTRGSGPGWRSYNWGRTKVSVESGAPEQPAAAPPPPPAAPNEPPPAQPGGGTSDAP
jgi:hypothetical protein